MPLIAGVIAAGYLIVALLSGNGLASVLLGLLAFIGTYVAALPTALAASLLHTALMRWARHDTVPRLGRVRCRSGRSLWRWHAMADPHRRAVAAPSDRGRRPGRRGRGRNLRRPGDEACSAGPTRQTSLMPCSDRERRTGARSNRSGRRETSARPRTTPVWSVEAPNESQRFRCVDERASCTLR